MARIRTIKPEFPQSETIGKLSRDARLLFIQLWTIVDDEGRARAASRMLASLLYPYDDDAPKLMEGWLGELEKFEMIRRYEANGSTYLEVLNWLKHQKIDKPSKSRLPDPREPSRTFAKPREASAPDLGPRTEDQDQDHRSHSVPSCDQHAQVRAHEDTLGERIEPKPKQRSWRDAFEIWYTAYPHKVGRGQAEKAFKSIAEKKLATLEELTLGVERYKRTKPLNREWKNPGTWLNQKCWLDEPADAGPGGARAVGPPASIDVWGEIHREIKERLSEQNSPVPPFGGGAAADADGTLELGQITAFKTDAGDPAVSAVRAGQILDLSAVRPLGSG